MYSWKSLCSDIAKLVWIQVTLKLPKTQALMLLVREIQILIILTISENRAMDIRTNSR